MKKVFTLIILAISLIIFTVTVRAQEFETKITKEASAPSYLLAYPGILPDNPLYKLKLLRDKFWLAITQDPIKKARLYLLLADKQIAMAKALAQKNEFALARVSALKGENELTELTYYYKNSNYKPDSAFLDTLVRASKKHREIFQEIQSFVPSKEKDIYSTLVIFSQRNQDEFNLIGQQP